MLQNGSLQTAPRSSNVELVTVHPARRVRQSMGQISACLMLTNWDVITAQHETRNRGYENTMVWLHLPRCSTEHAQCNNPPEDVFASLALRPAASRCCGTSASVHPPRLPAAGLGWTRRWRSLHIVAFKSGRVMYQIIRITVFQVQQALNPHASGVVLSRVTQDSAGTADADGNVARVACLTDPASLRID